MWTYLNYCKRLLEVLSWLLNVAQQPKAIWTIPQSRLRAELADGSQGCKPQPKQTENISDNSYKGSYSFWVKVLIVFLDVCDIKVVPRQKSSTHIQKL